MMQSGWSNFPRVPTRTRHFSDRDLDGAWPGHEVPMIARGNGRSYGDAALNLNLTLDMRRWDRLLEFDPRDGWLRCQSGVLLSDILRLFVPRGWFPAVTPGTSLITIGGAIAADVHGKNHHVAGSFGDHVRELELVTSSGERRRCSRTQDPELFHATCGGMGLTGIISEAVIRLIPIESVWIGQETLVCEDLDACLAGFDASADWTYSVAWIDCLALGRRLGRSLLHRGEHLPRDRLAPDRRRTALQLPRKTKLTVPVDLPSFTLNHASVRAFNELYHWRGRGHPSSVVDYESFFYPLDGVLQWNRIYGRRGFLQYQFVVPRAAGREALRAILSIIAKRGSPSFLAVLKLFGRPSSGLLSFPMEGYTLALDFPATAATFSLLRELDRIVADHAGRLYLAKDARADRRLIRTGYPQLSRFEALRSTRGGRDIFRSLLSDRLDI